MNFNYRFPATKGIQAKKEFFTLICPLEVVSKIFTFYNNEIPEEYRAQRVLNEKRVPEIKNYILNNPTSYIFSSITASIDGDYKFIPYSKDNNDIGTLEISMSANLLINDGQHRKAAIDEAIKENPLLKSEHISVVLFIDHGLEQSQQMFSDLNRHAVKVSNSLSLQYNHRDPQIGFMKDYLKSNEKLNTYIDISNDSLAQKSNKLFTLANFFTAIQNSYNNENIIIDKKLQKFVIDYWDYLTNNFKEWSFVFDKEVSPYNARKTSVSVYGVSLEALGKLGYYLYNNDIKPWKSYIKKLNKINWNKTNHDDWLNRCLLETGSVHKSTKFVNRTYCRIKELIDLPLTPSEIKSEDAYKKEQ